MTTVQFTLPDQLAAEAKRAGLLSSQVLERWLHEQLKARRSEQLTKAMDRMGAIDEPPTMSPAEIALEIQVMRTERRAQNKHECG